MRMRTTTITTTGGTTGVAAVFATAAAAAAVAVAIAPTAGVAAVSTNYGKRSRPVGLVNAGSFHPRGTVTLR